MFDVDNKEEFVYHLENIGIDGELVLYDGKFSILTSEDEYPINKDILSSDIIGLNETVLTLNPDQIETLKIIIH